MKTYVNDVLKAIKGSWRKSITEEEEAAKKGAVEKAAAQQAAAQQQQIDTSSKPAQAKPEEEEEEDSLFEKTKLNWLFRQLYIDTAHVAQNELQVEESKDQ
jgi:ribosomal protein L12E/L44/L45/RPP1/RPP2